MAKRRKTREEKIKTAQRLAQTSELSVPTFKFVKGEFSEPIQPRSEIDSKKEKQEITVQTEILASLPADLRKTFIIASIIFFVEAMLYFAMN